jgi:predicted ATP-binding protein involved in virulence
LKSISAQRVYGRRNLSFDVPTDAQVAFIHGQNGTGKSTLLRLLSRALSGDVLGLLEIEFSALHVELSEGDPIQVTRQGAEPDGQLEYRRGSETWKFPLLDAAEREWWRFRLEEVFGDDVPPDPAHWGAALGRRRGPANRPGARIGGPAKLEDMLLAQPALPTFPVEFIGTDRLRHSTPPTQGMGRRPQRNHEPSPLERQRRHLAQVIAEAQGRYAEKSQSLDRSFPRRLITVLNEPAPPLADLDQMFRRIGEMQDGFAKVRLLDQAVETDFVNMDTFQGQSAVLNVLATYLDDVDRKLDELRGTADQLSLFQVLANERLSRKLLEVSGDHGWQVRDADDGEEVAPSALSSGEQHQLYLLNSLIFPESSNTLFLIDEPEISLHVAWQRDLISDLERIAALGARQFILATHSPVVIGERSDLLVDVREQ